MRFKGWRWWRENSEIRERDNWLLCGQGIHEILKMHMCYETMFCYLECFPLLCSMRISWLHAPWMCPYMALYVSRNSQQSLLKNLMAAVYYSLIIFSKWSQQYWNVETIQQFCLLCWLRKCIFYFFPSGLMNIIHGHRSVCQIFHLG